MLEALLHNKNQQVVLTDNISISCCPFLLRFSLLRPERMFCIG